MAVNLKIHLMSKKHGWTKQKAESARLNFNLNMDKTKISESSRKSKLRCYNRHICPLDHCNREVLRLDNHLRQYHKVPNHKVAKLVSRSVPLLPLEVEESECSDSSSSSEDDIQTQMKEVFDIDVLHRGIAVLDSDSDDPDWLLSNYVDNNVIRQPAEKVIVQESQDEQQPDEQSDGESAEDNVDFEDLRERYFVTSAEEDGVLDRFVHWINRIEACW